MEDPECPVNQMINVLKDYKMGWYYKDQQNPNSFYGGVACEIVEANGPFPENQVLGTVNGTKFTALDGKFIAMIEEPIREMKALVVRCTDGAVLIRKWSAVQYMEGRRIEGYWYSGYDPQYPMPIPNKLSEEEAKEIFDLIKVKEQEAEMVHSRGSSNSRIDGSYVGSSEFHHKQWLWPEGFAEHYVLKYKVKPTDDFLKFLAWL